MKEEFGRPLAELHRVLEREDAQGQRRAEVSCKGDAAAVGFEVGVRVEDALGHPRDRPE